LSYIVPGLVNVWNLFLMRNFFMQMPESIEEAAIIDGASPPAILFRVVIPLSMSSLVTIGLFYAVGQWNAWQDTLFFTNSPRLETLQYVMVKVLRQAEAKAMANTAQRTIRKPVSITPESMKMAITMVATAPILFVYPFLQKYFVKGIMIGAVKG
jgi:putative aldouronate transport system permease protein